MHNSQNAPDADQIYGGGHFTFFALNRDNFVSDQDIRAKFGTYAGYQAMEPQQWSKRVIDELPPSPILGAIQTFFRLNRYDSAAICPILLKFSICVEYWVAEAAL